MQFVPIANQLFAILTSIAQLGAALILFALFVKTPLTKKLLAFFGKNALLLGFLIALVSTLGSLFYSEIAGYNPCKLCWYQRILMYPQVILLGMAYWRKDKHIIDYSIVLSTLGAGIAAYHYLLQRNVVGEILPCSAVGYSVSCAKTFVMTFGYITIPLMAFSAFLFIFMLMVAQKQQSKKKNS